MSSLELELSRKERLMKIDGNKQHILDYRRLQLNFFLYFHPYLPAETESNLTS